MAHKLERYYDPLSKEQLITARKKILLNANNLVEEASILFDNKKYSRSYFLCAIACEEIGKFIIISSAIIESIVDKIDWKKFWRKMRSHKSKIGTLEHAENIFVSSNDNFTDPNIIQTYLSSIEEYKMATLYSDVFHNSFIEPNEIINKEMVQLFLNLTKKRIEFFGYSNVSDDDLLNISKDEIIGIKRRLPKIFG